MAHPGNYMPAMRPVRWNIPQASGVCPFGITCGKSAESVVAEGAAKEAEAPECRGASASQF
jgi:hypothetical protein